MSLYGPEPGPVMQRATALAALFDRIVLAPADGQLPDYRTYQHGDKYDHPHLRIATSWEHPEWEAENRDIARQLLKSANIRAVLSRIPLLASDEVFKEDFLCRTLLQMRLADRSGSVLVGNSFFHTVCDSIIADVVDVISAPSNPGHVTWALDPSTLDLVGLNFPANSIDSFAAIRQSRQVSEYAVNFRMAVASAMSQPEATNSLLRAMKVAMDQEEIRNLASSGFKTIGSAANVGGLIPLYGTVSSIIAIGLDAGSRALDRSIAEKQWYLLGPKMREIDLKSMLSQLDRGIVRTQSGNSGI